ncbi:MAG: DUF899 domain-containing protein [Pseudomonadota bacterium]|nr:DUF899 domain-containing protein [Pseudomonadota bacterium]
MTMKVVDRSAWLAERTALLAEERALTAARDRVAELRRRLPVVRVDPEYRFATERGEETLLDLFKGRGQLIVSHFMFGHDWQEGCPNCSFWADSYSGIDVHLAARDTAFVTVSSAPLERLLAYRARMGWRFDWVSAIGPAFGHDFEVSYPDRKEGEPRRYNYREVTNGNEMPGISVLVRLDDGGIGHSYSTYGRGLDPMNSAYQLLDLTPAGRSESGLPWPTAWLRRRDSYGT